jgi:hypothetical protein
MGAPFMWILKKKYDYWWKKYGLEKTDRATSLKPRRKSRPTSPGLVSPVVYNNYYATSLFVLAFQKIAWKNDVNKPIFSWYLDPTLAQCTICYLGNNSRMPGSMLILTWVGIIFVIILHRANAKCKILTNIMPTHVKISIEPSIRKLFRF